MAKTKYDFTQITQYGSIIYRDVPSYSPDFLGTAGDAVLVRQFIKNYLPFYKTSVTSSTGSSIRVKIVETAWFANYSTNNSVTKVNLTETWLGDIIEPLFEGKGFDGMQDLEYSKPLPKLINTSDSNQDVSYGHNYIFVDAKDLIYKGYINLDDYRIGKGYLYQIFDSVSNYIKTGFADIPEIIVQYIKGEMTAPNEGDLVTLEKGPTVPVSAVTLTLSQQEMVDFLAQVGIVSLEFIKEKFLLSKLYGRTVILNELMAMDLVVADAQGNGPAMYQLTETGYDSVSEVGITPTVPVIAADLSSFETLLVDYLYTNGESPLQEIQSNFNYRSRQWVKDRIDELVDKGVVKFVGKSNNENYYYITSTGLVSTDALVASSTDEQMKVLNALLLNEGNIAIGVDDLAVITDYPEDLVINVVNGLEVFKLIDVLNVTNQVKNRRYAISKLGKEYLRKKNRQNRKANVETSTNPIKEFDTILEQEIIDFLAETQQEKTDTPMLYIIAEFESQGYEEYLIIEKVGKLVNEGFLFTAKSFDEVYYYPTPKGLERVTPKNNIASITNTAPSTNVTPKNSNLSEAKETFVDSLSSAADGGIYKNAVYEFVNKNSDTFKTMGKEDPDLYSAILGGLSFVLGQQSIKDIALEPFKPVENQQELEDDLISEDDLGDLDLEEIDLSGLEDDIQINDEDLGDLSDFDELKEFVENELEAAPEVKLLPSQYNVLKVLYRNNKTYPMAANMNADSIGIVLKQDNIIYTHNQILKYLGDLVDFEFVKMKNDQIGGIMFTIRVDGIIYVENKINTGKSQGGLRPSPSESATINNIGTIKTGNDGHPWEVKENKNGVKRWVKL